MTSPRKSLFLTPDTRSIAIDRSSHVRNVAYRPESRVLSVTFRNGDVYDYSGVDYVTAVGLATADSVGTYLREVVRAKHNGTKRKE